MTLSPIKNVPLDRSLVKMGPFDYALTISKKTPSQQLDIIKSLFHRHGFQYELVDKKEMGEFFVFFLAYNNIIGILRQAEKLHISKKRYSQQSDTQAGSKLKEILKHNSLKVLNPVISELEQRSLFSYSRRREFIEDGSSKTTEYNFLGDEEPFHEYIKIFTESELSRIILALIHSISIDTRDPDIVQAFNLKEQNEESYSSHRLVDFLTRHEIIDSISPLHTEGLENSLKDINSMTDYFGQNVSIYFLFMQFYTKWLIVPAIFGIVRQFLIMFDEEEFMTAELDTIYSIMIIIWATLFVKYWRRKSNDICMRWGSAGTQFKASDTRFNFQGVIGINPITQLPEYQFSSLKRFGLYVKSYMCHLPLMILSFIFMIIFLNALGYVDSHHWIYLESLSDLSIEGAIFDKNTNWAMIPTICQGLSMAVLASFNTKIAVYTTNRENHRTHTRYNNSIIFKKFMFEIVYTFLPLLYIAFWRLDEKSLTTELVTLYATDEIRRVVTEAFIPFIQKKLSAKKIIKIKDQSRDAYFDEKVHELTLAPYEAYDDYLEMVIQFGYITLFANAFPLSGAISLLFNVIEMKSDASKLKSSYQRPIPTVVNGIGSWQSLMNFMSHICLVTNTILIAYSTSFKKAVGDRLFPQDECEQYKLLILVFLLEHIIFIVVYSLRKKIQNEPKWVSIFKERSAKRSASLH